VGLVLAPAPAAVAAAPEAAASAQEKIICRYQDVPDLGSHIARRKKICMRESDWKNLEATNDQMKRRLQERALPTIQGQKPSLGSN
jgi:ribosome biogenesis protein Tsr3